MHTTIFSTHGACVLQNTLSPVFSEGSSSSLRGDPASSFPLAWWVACGFECTLLITCSFGQALIRPGLRQVLLCLRGILVIERRPRPNLVDMIYFGRQQSKTMKTKPAKITQAHTRTRKEEVRDALDKKLALAETGSSRFYSCKIKCLSPYFVNSRNTEDIENTA